MAYDGVTLYHLIEEFKPLFDRRSHTKNLSTEIDEIRLLVNLGNQKHHLLLSANASNPRAYMTEKIKENPSAPPSFCMVLRKYILNGTIVDITQHETDRVMEISISSKNDFNETVVRKLLVEIMGRNSNIILVDESMKILDSKKLDRLPADTVRSFPVGIIFIPRKITGMVFLISQRIVLMSYWLIMKTLPLKNSLSRRF